jgi:hypothetical protein
MLFDKFLLLHDLKILKTKILLLYERLRNFMINLRHNESRIKRIRP